MTLRTKILALDSAEKRKASWLLTVKMKHQAHDKREEERGRGCREEKGKKMERQTREKEDTGIG